jgi:hypothetical protein
MAHTDCFDREKGSQISRAQLSAAPDAVHPVVTPTGLEPVFSP